MVTPDRKRTSRKEFLRTAAVGAALTACAGFGVSCGPTLAEKLTVEPKLVRSDEPFVVRLRDLSPGERVTISAEFADVVEGEWISAAVFEATEAGDVDTARQAPVEGSYGVEDPMGLVWSAVGGSAYAPSLRPSVVKVTALVGEEEASAKVRRYAMADGVEARDVREDGLVGRLFLPAGARPAPGMLVFGGSEGGLSPYVEGEAALLASHGYAALALAYFKGQSFAPEGAGGLPDGLVEVPLEYFGRAMGWLKGQEAALDDRIGVLGHSYGGQLALLLGANYPEIKAVVSYVGSGMVTSSPMVDRPAWTFRGEPVPRIPFFDPSEIARQQKGRAAIPVERTEGPVLMIAGGDDGLWDAALLSKIAMDRLERNKRAYEDRLLVYPDAGHTILAPYVPTGVGLDVYGGKARANAEASEDSWREVLDLLERRLKG